MKELKIKKEFRNLIPPLTQKEFDELEKSILTEGCRDAIICWKNTIIDGHNRYQICKKHNIPFEVIKQDFNEKYEVKIWMIKNQFARRNMDYIEKSVLALELKNIYKDIAKEKERVRKTTYHKSEKSKLEKLNTNKKVSELANVSHNTINKLEHILASEYSDLKKLLFDKALTIDRAEKERKIRDKEKKRKERAETGKSIKTSYKIELGDFNEVLDYIEPGTVKAIITDPPYDRESIKCYTELAKFAQEKLTDNGFLACYAGHLYLPEVMNELGKYLDYYWVIGMVHQGHTSIVKPVNVICDWKPILVYQKKKKKSERVFHDLITCGIRDKEFHPWGQAVDEAITLIDNFSERGDLIVDPFLGGGTTLIAANTVGRNFIGAEIDEVSYNNILYRIRSLRKEKIKKILNYLNKINSLK